MTETKDRLWLAAYARLLEEKLQWGPVRQWSQRDFENLSELLLDQTGVLISVTTLKRALGRVTFQGMPLQTTLNALVQFIGYPDWAHFKSHPELVEQVKETPVAIQQPKAARHLIWALVASGLCVLLLASYFMLKPKLPLLTGPQAFLHASDARGDSAPHKVHFEYFIPPEYHKDVILISYGDQTGISYANYDSQGRGKISHNYTEKGFYSVKLFANKTELAKIPVLLASDSWLLSVGNLNHKITAKPVLNQGILTIGTAELNRFEHDTIQRIYSSFKTFREFGINADSLRFRARIRSQATAYNAHLPKLQLRLGALGGVVKLTLDKSETSRDVYNQFSEYVVPVNEQKKFFMQDISDWSLLELNIKNHKFQVRVNDKLIYEGQYERPLEHLYSISLDFRGLGEVDFVKVYNGNDRLAYQDEF